MIHPASDAFDHGFRGFCIRKFRFKFIEGHDENVAAQIIEAARHIPASVSGVLTEPTAPGLFQKGGI